MADQTHLDMLAQGVEAWNAWREKNITYYGESSPVPDLIGADLSEAKLARANLSETKLTGADLSGADLSGADLSGADLDEVDLTGAKLTRARLSRREWYPERVTTIKVLLPIEIPVFSIGLDSELLWPLRQQWDPREHVRYARVGLDLKIEDFDHDLLKLRVVGIEVSAKLFSTNHWLPFE